VILSATGCSGAQSNEGVFVEDKVPVSNPLELIDLAEDKRTLVPRLDTLINQTDRKIRLRLAVAVGRIGDAKGSAILVPMLSDPDPEVREAAYFASGMLGTIPKELKQALVSRLEVEDRTDGILAIVDAIGRSGETEDLALLDKLVNDMDPQVRASAMQAVGFGAIRNLPVSKEIAINIAGYLKDKSENVRLMSAFALSEIDRILRSETVVQALSESAFGDPSVEVRILALKALAKWEGFDEKKLARALEDPDSRVSAAAVQSIARVNGTLKRKLIEQALGTVAARLDEDKELAEQEYALIARSALENAIRYKGARKIRDHAILIAKTVESLEKPRPACAARILCLARLVAGRNNLALLSCDPTRPEGGKQIAMQNLYHGADTSHENLEILKELVADTNLRVAVTAIAFLGRIDQAGAKNAVVDALDDDRAIVVTAALDTISVLPKNFLNLSGGRKNKNLIRAIGKVVDRFTPFEHAHAPLISSAQALKALGDPSGKSILIRLGSDPRPSVRHAVLDAFHGMRSIEPPVGLAPLAPTRPFPHSEKEKIQTAKARAVIMTSRGGFSISLNADTAPAAVESFISLAGSGFFNVTPIHRVVPGSLVQAGDPTGTGLGDPGYSLRSEPSQIPFHRGTVGMAQSRKDASGSQFFIALSRQPGFDGTYTVLGQVTSGMETVDLLEEGDIIEEVMVQVD
jgi:peptidyl-prolyl cis-trans isomerase B (cyclophilin B)